MERFGAKLRALRKRHGMTQERLASELGFTHTHVYHLEAGKKLPNVLLVERLTRIFQVTFDQLLDDTVELE